jgi:REP element-mobilizing transposase RayT
MSRPRAFPFPDSKAGVFHAVSRIAGRLHLIGDEEKAFFIRVMRAYADLLGVRLLTWCVMSNHFHILVHVPQRPPGDGPPLHLILERMEAAVGREHMTFTRKQLAHWEQMGAHDLIEAWRRRQVAAMFSLSEFVQRVKQRFTRWYNKRTGRTGVLWEDRFASTIVEDGERALRMMAAYIDLNPVRAGLVTDPGDYPWSGYAAAMSGDEAAQEGLARIAGVARVEGGGAETNRAGKARRLRGLVAYRQMLGVTGRERKTADGTVVRRGLSEKVRERLLRASGVRREQCLRRIRQLSAGVLVGSREFVDEWFARNRHHVQGRSREERRSGARPIGKPWRGLHCLRRLQKE